MTVPTTAEFWEIAHTVCTSKEQDVLALKAGGLGWRRIGRKLGISPEAVRGRYERAERRIHAEHQRRQEAA